jgi:phenolic acid decarboxylase
MHAPTETLVGTTVRWRFDDGPVAGRNFEHRFNDDESVEYRMLDDHDNGRWARAEKCATSRLTDKVFAMSYLATNGYTLTAVLDFQTGAVVAFASNEKDWSAQEGAFELVR